MAKKLTIIFGIVFIVIGILGFISNPIVGREGFFMTNAVHDLVHIISGIVFLIVASKSDQASSTVLTVFGVIYLLVTLLGFIAGGDGNLLGLAVNGADNVLHLVLAVVFLIAGLSTKSKMSATA
jgi:hypothetical protein